MCQIWDAQPDRLAWGKSAPPGCAQRRLGLGCWALVDLLLILLVLGVSACCTSAAAAAAAAFSSLAILDLLLGTPPPATPLPHCLLCFAKVTSNPSSLSLEVSPGSFPWFWHDSHPLLGLVTACPPSVPCTSCITVLITLGRQRLFTGPAAPLAHWLCEGRSSSRWAAASTSALCPVYSRYWASVGWSPFTASSPWEEAQCVAPLLSAFTGIHPVFPRVPVLHGLAECTDYWEVACVEGGWRSTRKVRS